MAHPRQSAMECLAGPASSTPPGQIFRMLDPPYAVAVPKTVADVGKGLRQQRDLLEALGRQ